MLYADRILGGRHAGIVAGLDRPVKFPLFLVKGSDFLLKPLDFSILFRNLPLLLGYDGLLRVVLFLETAILFLGIAKFSIHTGIQEIFRHPGFTQNQHSAPCQQWLNQHLYVCDLLLHNKYKDSEKNTTYVRNISIILLCIR